MNRQRERERLKEEASFQDKRMEQDGSPRKFQHLIREEYSYLLSAIGDVKGKKILTMGCSTGGVTPFAKKGAWVLGVDISHLALKELSSAIKLEGLADSAVVIEMNCEELALYDEFFDIVLFIGVLHHLDIKRALVESHRVLKPGGKVFLSEPLGLHPLVNLYRLLTPNQRTPEEHPLKPNDFKIMKNYFVIEEFKGFCLTSIVSLTMLYLFKSDTFYEFLRKFLIKLDNLIVKAIPCLKYFCWSAVVVLTKEN